jgi:hypothetical protein
LDEVKASKVTSDIFNSEREREFGVTNRTLTALFKLFFCTSRVEGELESAQKSFPNK